MSGTQHFQFSVHMAEIKPSAKTGLKVRRCGGGHYPKGNFMSDSDVKLRLSKRTKTEKPKLYKVVLLNDDYTPREFVVLILKGEFRLDSAQAEVVMLTAHQKGACVVSVYPKDVAETKATRAIDAAGRLGYPLQFNVEPE